MLPRLFIVFLATLLLQPELTTAAEESFGDAIKKIFATPTPTPKPRKKKSSSAKKKSIIPTPTPKKSGLPRPIESPTPVATASPKKKKTRMGEEESPSPHRKKKASPSPQPFRTAESENPASTPSSAPVESATPSPSPRHGAVQATVSPDQIKGFDNYAAKVQKLLTSALELTTRNLNYKYGSADPANGGMDCSGFVYFVLRQNGIDDVPRDSTEQYNWLRRRRAFQPVLSTRDDSYELNDLRPGDILFWTGTYSVERDPPITHTMIYVGREKKSGNRIMIGSSDGRVYQGQSRDGVSVFDFNVHRARGDGEAKLHPVFVGYGHVPGLQD